MLYLHSGVYITKQWVTLAEEEEVEVEEDEEEEEEETE